MFKTSLIALGIVMASGGLALAQQSPSGSGSPHPPPKPGMHHHQPPPPPPGGHGLQGKGFDLHLGHGRGLRVQCGDEQLKSCIQAAQPLLSTLGKSSKHGRHWNSQKMSGEHGDRATGTDSANSKDSLMDRNKSVSPNQSQQSGSSGSQTQ